jgi:short-subunit dehydrogenase
MADPHGTALITGASMGLGREYARLFAADGHDVILVARSEGKLQELARELEAARGIKTSVLAEDLGDPAAPERVFKWTQDRGLQVDYLVNNAGFGTSGAFVDLDRKREVELVQVNIGTLVHLTRLVLPAMVSRRRGRILNIASTAGFVPGPFIATYYASKAFVISFTEAIAWELRGKGVTATVHCPGATATAFSRTAGNDRSILFRLSQADAGTVVRHGYRAMMSGRVVSVPGFLNWLSTQSSRFGPRAVLSAVSAWLNSTR